MEVVSPAGKAKTLSEGKRRLLEQRMRGLAQRRVEPVSPRPLQARTPASAEQYRVWLHASREPELPIYNESVTVHRRGSFDLSCLEASLNAVLQRHEAWRTSFVLDDGELLQVIHPDLQIKLPMVDLMGIDGSKVEAEACRLASEDARLPFDLEAAPLFRARVFRLAADHHWLQLTLHHLVFDGVCLHRVFVPELAELYAAFASGSSCRLETPTLQYGDYAVWQKAQLRKAEMEKHLDYWRSELSGELPVLRLPVDRARPAVISHRGAMECFAFSTERTDALRALGRANDATLSMVLLAGLKTLLFRYSGQEDLIIGGLADGRRSRELEGLMGCFLQTFAVRTRPCAGVPFTEYLREVRRSTLGALAAAEIPFEQVVQAVHPQRDESHHPVFQTFFAVQPEREVLVEGWEISKTMVEVETSKFDLYVEVEERSGGLAVRLMYSTDLFDAATIVRMGSHWTTLMDGVLGQPDCPLGELPLLTHDERERMLVEWNRTSAPLPMMAVHEAVDEQARRRPNAIAVEFGSQVWTYSELARRVDELAWRLKRAGVSVGDLVAVFLERSLDLLCALLAVLKVGGAYLPLDPGSPAYRRAQCLEDAMPLLLLSQRSLLIDGSCSEFRTLLLNEDQEEHPVFEDGGWGKTAMDASAYVIHTSGSTGRPKGVEISHGALMNLLVSMQKRPGFSEDDCLLAVTTVSFDIAALEMFLPLISGGRLVITNREVALDPYLLAEAIEVRLCTVMQATPSTWRSLLSSGWQGSPGLRILCGGESLPRDLAESMLRLGMEVWNVYGPTETTIWSTCDQVVPGTGPVSVGRPICNTRVYILDGRQEAVPIGVQGELYLGGAGVAKGYWRQEDLTRQRFTTVAVAGGEKLYRTGDYAVYRADGRIEIQGRTDNQVKVRGHRIELEDVEAALGLHANVAAAAAKAWPDGSGGSRLSAYVVARQGTSLEVASLREFLRVHVPEYMVPSNISRPGSHATYVQWQDESKDPSRSCRGE